jgi:hypothetical protein
MPYRKIAVGIPHEAGCFIPDEQEIEKYYNGLDLLAIRFPGLHGEPLAGLGEPGDRSVRRGLPAVAQ